MVMQQISSSWSNIGSPWVNNSPGNEKAQQGELILRAVDRQFRGTVHRATSRSGKGKTGPQRGSMAQIKHSQSSNGHCMDRQFTAWQCAQHKPFTGSYDEERGDDLHGSSKG